MTSKRPQFRVRIVNLNKDEGLPVVAAILVSLACLISIAAISFIVVGHDRSRFWLAIPTAFLGLPAAGIVGFIVLPTFCVNVPYFFYWIGVGLWTLFRLLLAPVRYLFLGAARIARSNVLSRAKKREFRRKLREWRMAGYDVSELEDKFR